MITVHIHHDSIGAACTDWRNPFKNRMNKNKAEHYCMNPDVRAKWYGDRVNAPDCLEMAQTKGYAKGLKKFEEFHAKLSAKLPRALGIKRTKTRAELGNEFDYHAMLKGNNDKAWTSSTRALKRGNGIVRLCVDIGGNASKDATRLSWRGIAGITLSEILRSAGYSVELVACFAVSNPHWNSRKKDLTVIFSCTVKPRNATPDLGQLAATVGFGGFFRTVGFAGIVRACDTADVMADSGLGHYRDVSGIMPVDGRVMQLFVPENVYGEREAREWIEQSIQLLQGDRA